MEIEKMTIRLKDIRVYAYHGVMPQENKVGNIYTVNVSLDLNDCAAAMTDDLSLTVNYAEVVGLIKAEMAKPAKLLEALAYRIAKSVIDNYSMVDSVELSIEKDNPPVSADIASSGVCVKLKR